MICLAKHRRRFCDTSEDVGNQKVQVGSPPAQTNSGSDWLLSGSQDILSDRERLDGEPTVFRLRARVVCDSGRELPLFVSGRCTRKRRHRHHRQSELQQGGPTTGLCFPERGGSTSGCLGTPLAGLADGITAKNRTPKKSQGARTRLGSKFLLYFFFQLLMSFT